MEGADTTATTAQKSQLFEFIISNDLSISIAINSYFILAIIALTISIILIKIFFFRNYPSLEINEAEFGLGNQKIKLKPNNIDAQIAYKIWVELSTRKIGLELDLEKDVIIEIYDSWYQFFGITRELIKEIPVSKLKRQDTKKIVHLSIDVLNKGVRPHLTAWQARFRKWYDKELAKEDNIDTNPQGIQAKYPYYDELTNDLMTVNQNLIQYREAMQKLSIGEIK